MKLHCFLNLTGEITKTAWWRKEMCFSLLFPRWSGQSVKLMWSSGLNFYDSVIKVKIFTQGRFNLSMTRIRNPIIIARELTDLISQHLSDVLISINTYQHWIGFKSLIASRIQISLVAITATLGLSYWVTGPKQLENILKNMLKIFWKNLQDSSGLSLAVCCSS